MEEHMEKKDEAPEQDAVPEEAQQAAEPFVPSSKSRRIFAWVLFVIVILGIISWLLGIAFPHWVDAVKDWTRGLFS